MNLSIPHKGISTKATVGIYDDRKDGSKTLTFHDSDNLGMVLVTLNREEMLKLASTLLHAALK